MATSAITSSPTSPPHRMDGDVPIHPKISNIVAGVDSCCIIDQKLVALHARGAKYNPKRFPAVILRIKEPKATAMIFHKGKMQILGTKSVEEAHLAGRKFARIMQKLGFEPKFENFNVQNVVASIDTKMAIRLEGVLTHPVHHRYASYEPELFPDLCYRMESPKVTFLVFSKGKVVAVGARSVEHVHEAWEKMCPILLGFRIEA